MYIRRAVEREGAFGPQVKLDNEFANYEEGRPDCVGSWDIQLGDLGARIPQTQNGPGRQRRPGRQSGNPRSTATDTWSLELLDVLFQCLY